MGIQGLLPLLKSIQKPCNLKQFAGQTIGVDAYGWLHRGTVACAVELATGKPTTKYVDFAMSRVRMLKHFGITPYLVFDGDYLPSKSKTEKERSARRKESKRLGLELLSLGKTSQAYVELQKAVDVTPEMAGLLIEELKRANVQYVVAPYEADSQMVYLEKKGIIDGILSEDSDLLVFGAKKLLTKLDQYGDCVMIRRDDFTACREVSLVGWTDKEFRQMAIMSGCDYLNSIEKMGLKTAYRLIRKYKTIDRVVRAVQFDGKFKVPAGYLEAFNQAELTFLHQWVYCPEAKSLVNFNPLEEGKTHDDLQFIGNHVEARVAGGVARGELHPHTKEPLQLPVVPTRRWMGPPQKKPTMAETPELKKHKSIDSFFKPKRTPLAELDVNLFTGSPSQQEMTRRASGSSWPATPIGNTPSTAVTRPSAMLSSAPVTASRTFSDSASARRITSERAPKRQRLCTDSSSPVTETNTDRVEYVKSKFFSGGSSSSATPSKRTKSTRAATDFTLWSDDSVEEAMREMPLQDGINSQPKSKKKLQVFDDNAWTPPAEKALSAARDSTEESQVTNVFPVSKPDQMIAWSSSSPSSAEDGRPATPFDASLRAEIAGLRDKFGFKSGNVSTSVPRNPLQRTSPAKTDHNASKVEEEVDPTDLEKSPEAAAVSQGQTNREPGDDIVVPGSDAVEPASPAKTVADPGQPAGITGGSEDLLISESEAEGSEAGTPKARVFLNLGRFAFGAA